MSIVQVKAPSGLITSDKRGQFVHYAVADDNLLGTLTNYLSAFCPVGGPLKKESAAMAKAGKARSTGTAATDSAPASPPAKSTRKTT